MSNIGKIATMQLTVVGWDCGDNNWLWRCDNALPIQDQQRLYAKQHLSILRQSRYSDCETPETTPKVVIMIGVRCKFEESSQHKFGMIYLNTSYIRDKYQEPNWIENRQTIREEVTLHSVGHKLERSPNSESWRRPLVTYGYRGNIMEKSDARWS